jgi:hypothetical protein
MKKEDLIKGMKLKSWTGEILTYVLCSEYNSSYAYCLDVDGKGVFVAFDKLEEINGKVTKTNNK